MFGKMWGYHKRRREMSIVGVVRGWFHSRNIRSHEDLVSLREIEVNEVSDEYYTEIHLIFWSKNKSTTKHKNIVSLSKEDARSLWRMLTPLVTEPVPTEEPHTCCCSETNSTNESIHRVYEDSEVVEDDLEDERDEDDGEDSRDDWEKEQEPKEEWKLQKGSSNIWVKVEG
jgi:hypothetical protein